MDDATLKNKLYQPESKKNYYEILGCSATASFKELKQSYQDLIKKFHPDKQTGSLLSSDRFVLIDKAYKTLKDENLRKEYDASLLGDSLNGNSLIYAELAKEDLNFNEEGIAHYPCRCGDNFNIEKEYLNESECIVECSECTNCVLIR